MKEIKFRLRVDNKIVGYEKWYCGVREGVCLAEPCWLYSKDGKYWNPDYIYHTHKDQYTGLKDKNGREIYEGDILQTKQGSFEVRWSNCYARYMAWVHSGCWFYLNEPLERKRQTENFEIIGNIYENPELLK